jgi:hypothetical protein
VSSLSGQSVGLWGQASQVASCGSHSAGMEKPRAAGVVAVVGLRVTIRLYNFYRNASPGFTPSFLKSDAAGQNLVKPD